MNKDVFRGLIVGAILALIVGYGILYIRTLNLRVTGIETFLNNAIKQGQQRQQVIQPQEIKK